MSITVLTPGTKLAGRELLCPLAQGGMGSVWLARALDGPTRLVAIKFILPQHAADERFRMMFLDEVRVADNLNHPNVVAVIDAGEEAGQLYSVMEWVDGDSLRALLRSYVDRDESFPLGIALRVICDVCLGLHAVHELTSLDGQLLDVVHRDVSPHNVLIGSDGIAKVIDFGIATARTRLTRETTTGVVKGRIDYLSPEQAAGAPVDRRADIWAIGAVLYHLFSGGPPNDGGDLAAMRRLLNRQPLASLPPTVPTCLRAIVAKCMQWEPSLRYPTAKEVAQAVEQAALELQLDWSRELVACALSDRLTDGFARRAAERCAAIEALEQRAVAQGQTLAHNDSSRPTRLHIRSTPSARPQRALRGWLVLAVGVTIVIAVGLWGRTWAVERVRETAPGAASSAAPRLRDTVPAGGAAPSVVAATSAAPRPFATQQSEARARVHARQATVGRGVSGSAAPAASATPARRLRAEDLTSDGF